MVRRGTGTARTGHDARRKNEPRQGCAPEHRRNTRRTDPSRQRVWLRGCNRQAQTLLLRSGKRSGAWLKYKVNKSQEFVIGGYTPGNPLDAVIVGYYDGGKLIYVAKVKNGFVPQLRRDVWQKLKPLEIASCPFANLPEKKPTQFSLTREQMKDCIWLKPQLVAQVELTEWTPDGYLRHSKFIGLRDDKDPREVGS